MNQTRIALLDINVLLALFDPMHVHHESAHEWFARNRESGWASCPITENGFVRVLSNPNYAGVGTTISEAIDRLVHFRRSGNHQFWADSVSLMESELVHPAHIQGYRQLTDVYLLALAVENGGRLATFDRRISESSVVGSSGHLVRIPGLHDSP